MQKTDSKYSHFCVNGNCCKMCCTNYLFVLKCPYYWFILKFIDLSSWRQIVPNQSLIYVISSASCLPWLYIQLQSNIMYILTILSMHLQPYMNHTINYPEMSILSNCSEILRIIPKSYWNNFFTFCFFPHPALAISNICSNI